MNKFVLKIFIVSCGLLTGITTYSQVNPLDKEYTLPENSIFSSTKSNATNFELPKNTIMFRASELIRQDAIFQYERLLFNPVSLSFSIGFPFGKDYIEEWSSEIGEKEGSDDVSIYTLNSISNFSSGFIWGTSLRVYPSSDDNSSVFYELAYKNSIINNKITESKYSNKEFQTSLKYFGLSFGYKWSNSTKKVKFVNELSYGMGLKVVKWENYKMDYIIDPNTSDTYEYYYKTSSEGKYAFIYMSLKYNLGFGF